MDDDTKRMRLQKHADEFREFLRDPEGYSSKKGLRFLQVTELFNSFRLVAPLPKDDYLFDVTKKIKVGVFSCTCPVFAKTRVCTHSLSWGLKTGMAKIPANDDPRPLPRAQSSGQTLGKKGHPGTAKGGEHWKKPKTCPAAPDQSDDLIID